MEQQSNALDSGNCVTESVKESNQVPSSQKPDLESETPKLENDNMRLASESEDINLQSKPTHHDADEERCYYEEYCKLYCTSMIMAQKIKDLLIDGCNLQNCIERINSEKKKYESMMIPGMFIPSDRNGKQLVRMIAKPKRHRRTKGEIQRKFRCSTKGCSKSYGSEGSLNQHIKLKHPDSWANIINAGKVKKI